MEGGDFPVVLALDRIAPVVAAYPKPAMFQLADEGYRSVFAQLVSCMISIRTKEEVTLRVSRALHAAAPTPADVAALPVERLESLLAQSTFAERKARQIHDIAVATVERFDGALPCDGAALQSFSGVGPKCANLTLGVACDIPAVSVDVHVDRVVHRWGAVTTTSPEQTTIALERIVPRDRWIDINRLLMPFGRYICTAALPRCSTCPVNDLCPRIGVTHHR
jgi:endonuclease III